MLQDKPLAKRHIGGTTLKKSYRLIMSFALMSQNLPEKSHGA